MRAQLLRRFAAVALLATLAVTTAVTPALAGSAAPEPTITRDQAVAIARGTFAIPAALGEPEVNFSQSSGPFSSYATWTLNWGPKKGERGPRYYISIQANSGELVNFNFDRGEQEKLPPLSLTRDEAEKKADAVVSSIAVAHLGELQLRRDPLELRYFYPGEPAIYSFYYERLYKGAPVQGQGVDVAVDGRTGEVIRYNLNWDREMNFATDATPMSGTAAEAAWQQQLNVEPAYVLITPPGKEQAEWWLVYRARSGGFMLDAVTGKLIDWSGQPVTNYAWSGYKPLPTPPQPYKAPAQPLDREQALALVRSVTGQDLPEPTHTSYSESGKETRTQTYNFNWDLADMPAAGWQTSINVGVDARRGLVVNFGQYRYFRTSKQPEEIQESDLIAVEKARQSAVDFFLKARPDLAPNLKESPNPAPTPWCRQPGEARDERQLCTDYRLELQYFHNDIAVLPTTVSVGVDLRTGLISNMWSGQEPGRDELGPLPAPELKVTAAQAAAAYIKATGLRLVWNNFYPAQLKMQYVKFGKPSEARPEARLVYVVTNQSVTQVDSQTGHALDDQGRDLTRLSTRPTDITGHWAQKEIELLLTRGVMTANDGIFAPGATVTRGEAAQMLILAKGQRPIIMQLGGYAFGDLKAAAGAPAPASAPYVEAAVRAGIVRTDEEGADFRPDEPITREEAALWTARAIDYGDGVSMDAAISAPFADAPQTGERYRNAVALLAGLGVIKGTPGGSFRPQAQLSRGEAAIFLFAVMSEGRFYGPYYGK